MKDIREDPYIEQITRIALEAKSKIYLVGGAVRDFLSYKDSNDYDFVVIGDIDKIAKQFSKKFLCKLVTYNKKLKTHRIFCRLKSIDISEPRGRTIEEDLINRDFTINSIALDMSNFTIIDPLKGKEDLEKGIVRINREKSIKDDPLRILRGFRIAATFRFDIEANTIALFRKNVNLLKNISKERITEELKLLFSLEETFTYLLIMDKVGVIDTIFEDLNLTNACIQSIYHLYDVKTHSLNVYNYIEWAYRRLEKILSKHSYKKYLMHYTLNKRLLLISLKLAALFHDAAKPFCKIIIDGRVKFPHHEIESAKLFEKYAKLYPFGKKITNFTKFLIENHIKPAELYKLWSLNELEETKTIEYFFNYREKGIDLLFFALADTLAKGKISYSKREVYIMFLREMAAYYYLKIEPRLKDKTLISAREIIEAYPNIDKRKLNPILTAVKKLQISGSIRSKSEALSIIKNLI